MWSRWSRRRKKRSLPPSRHSAAVCRRRFPLASTPVFSARRRSARCCRAMCKMPFAAYAEDYGHQYRYQLDILNDGCDSSIFFSSLGYQVDVFENADAAAKALNDNFTRTLLQSEGFQHDEFTLATYRREATTCDGEAGVRRSPCLQRDASSRRSMSWFLRLCWSRFRRSSCWRICRSRLNRLLPQSFGGRFANSMVIGRPAGVALTGIVALGLSAPLPARAGGRSLPLR